MKKIANGTNTHSVITSCTIFSCASDSAVKPIRFAGTCSRYSNSAMPHETSAASHHGQVCTWRRCPYQAKVMNTFDAARSSTQTRTGDNPARKDTWDYRNRYGKVTRKPASRSSPYSLDHVSPGAIGHASVTV